MKNKRFHTNSLLFKVLCTAVVGIICLTGALSLVNVTISKRVFVNSFAESQSKIFNQIDQEFYDFYRDMVDIMSLISGSENMERFLKGEYENQISEMNNFYRLKQQLKNSKIADHNDLSIFVLGKDDKGYMYSNSDVFSVPKSEIWESDVARKAKENPRGVICQYEKAGFTNVMKSTPVVIMAKAWSYSSSGEIEGIVFITIKESILRGMYDHFTSETSDIVLLNQDNEIVSSDNRIYFDEESEEFLQLEKVLAEMNSADIQKKEVQQNANIQTYLMQRLQSTHYKIVGIINPEAAFMRQYNILNLVLLTLAITAGIVGLIIYFMRQQAKPLAGLARTMRNSRQMEFHEHVPVEGTQEIQELSETYNLMVDELERYIQQKLQAEEDKRSAEIHALQMQINPHYMYNTLSSVKWLIWQGDAQKSTEVIDAFISLLRNVISNSDEFVTVDQEIVNLKNYVLINQARYGDAIRVEFFVAPQCSQYKVPKLILQPFVENAFFHAFPEGRTGSISVFVKETEDRKLRFEIADDGVGIQMDSLRAINRKENAKSEHFTGIGIGNVDDRIKLIYGMDYGINITSEEGQGTRVTLLLPQPPG